MAKAEWNGVIIAEESDASKLINVEGNVYFPPESVKMDLLAESSYTTVCGWKGLCNYYHVTVDGKTASNGAWIYKKTKPGARDLEGRYVRAYARASENTFIRSRRRCYEML